jgi:hypothetical protein
MITLIICDYLNDPRDIIEEMHTDELFLQYLHDGVQFMKPQEALEELYDTMLEFDVHGLDYHSELIREFLEQVNLAFLK